MVGPHLGWAVGAYAIFGTADGTHWSKQYASTEQFVGVDFVSATTGWAVGVRTLLGTTDGGHSWRSLGEPSAPLRSVHFISPLRGWGIAGGTNLVNNHGTLLPEAGGSLVVSTDGGVSWANLMSPGDPESVCFSDAGHGWLGTASGRIFASNDAGQTWSQADEVWQSGTGVGLEVVMQCAAPSAVWIAATIDNGAAGHLPYVVYAGQDATHWRTVMAEAGTAGSVLAGVPAGPGTHPGSFSVVDGADAVFIGDGPASMVSQCVIASSGGAVLQRTGSIANSSETFAAAFVSLASGWVLTRNANGDYVVDATTDGGYHWSQQLAVMPSSAG